MKKTKNTCNTTYIIITSLVILCAAVWAGSAFLTGEPETDFAPKATETVIQTETWEESTPAGDLGKTLEAADTAIPNVGTPADGILEITEGTLEDGYTAELTRLPEGKPDLEPPAPPVTNFDTSNPDIVPEYDDSVVETKDLEDPHYGQVYDPVFGWVTPADVKQDTVDSTGDINRQIGTMGGN